MADVSEWAHGRFKRHQKKSEKAPLRQQSLWVWEFLWFWGKNCRWGLPFCSFQYVRFKEGSCTSANPGTQDKDKVQSSRQNPVCKTQKTEGKSAVIQHLTSGCALVSDKDYHNYKVHFSTSSPLFFSNCCWFLDLNGHFQRRGTHARTHTRTHTHQIPFYFFSQGSTRPDICHCRHI